MRSLYRVAAESVFVFHIAVFVLIVFGWLWPALWPLYMATLVATFVFHMIYGQCLLSIIEFGLRKKYDPAIRYDYAWTTYYTYKLTAHRIRDGFYLRASTVFLVSAISVNAYFAFLY